MSKTDVLKANIEIEQKQFDLKVFVLLMCGFTKKSISEKYNTEVKASPLYNQGYLRLYNNKIFTELLEKDTPRRNKLLQLLDLRTLGVLKKEKIYKQKQKQQVSIEEFLKAFPTLENQGELIRFLYFNNEVKRVINNQIVEKSVDTRTVTYLLRDNQEIVNETNLQVKTEAKEPEEIQVKLNKKQLKRYIFTINNISPRVLYENRLSKKVKNQFPLGVFEADIKDLKLKIKTYDNKKLVKLSICTFIEKYQLEENVFLYKNKEKVLPQEDVLLLSQTEEVLLSQTEGLSKQKELPIYKEVQKLEQSNKEAEATISELIKEVDKIKEKLVKTLKNLKGEEE